MKNKLRFYLSLSVVAFYFGYWYFTQDMIINSSFLHGIMDSFFLGSEYSENEYGMEVSNVYLSYVAVFRFSWFLLSIWLFLKSCFNVISHITPIKAISFESNAIKCSYVVYALFSITFALVMMFDVSYSTSLFYSDNIVWLLSFSIHFFLLYKVFGKFNIN